MVTLCDLIERQSKEHPRANALFSKGNLTSYSELSQKIERWAAVLAARGITAKDTFGVVMRNSPEFVITFFAF